MSHARDYLTQKLLKRAVVVLSNNDGCVISRSDEAKNWNKNGGTFF